MKTVTTPPPDICEYSLPDKGITSPLVVDLPHGGTIYPSDFNYACTHRALELCEEIFLDELYIPPALAAGGVAIKANFPRTYIDPNRHDHDIDELLLDAPWPSPILENGRSSYGQGVIMRLTTNSQPVYERKLSHAEFRHRLASYYSVYHSMLGEWLEAAYQTFGCYYHLNCHSMPSSAVAHFFPHLQPDFILGDLDSRSCSLDFRQAIAEGLRGKGYRVTINQIYKGAEIVSRYGQPAWNRNSLQVEINRALIMNETTRKKSAHFENIQKDLADLIGKLNFPRP